MSAGDDAEYARWERGNLRGLAKKTRFVGTEKDADGNEVNVYEAAEDEEWNSAPERQRLIHLEYHRSIFDPNCAYCHLYREK